MQDAPPAAKPPDDDDGNTHGLGTWERWLAGVVGLAGVVAGGVGVFLSDNQAGTTAILLLGSVFLLMAVQGTAIIKAGKDSVELERRKKALDLSERAAEKLEQKDLPAADAYQEAAKAVDPSIRSDPAFRAVDERIYTSAAIEAVLRNLIRLEKALGLGRPFNVGMLPNSSNSSAYLTVTDDADASRRVTVAIRRRLHSPDGNTTYVSIIEIIKGLEGNILIVSEVGPPKNVAEKTRSVLTGRSAEIPNVEFVQWTGAVDDPVLEDKLSEMLK
jgi:hypothetical protein